MELRYSLDLKTGGSQIGSETQGVKKIKNHSFVIEIAFMFCGPALHGSEVAIQEEAACRAARREMRAAKDRWFQRKALEAERGRHGQASVEMYS